MSKQVELACTVCTDEFAIAEWVYAAHSSVVPCPCCGSTDLILLGVVERAGRSEAGANGTGSGA